MQVGRLAWSRPTTCGSKGFESADVIAFATTVAVAVTCTGLIPSEDVEDEREENYELGGDGPDYPMWTKLGILDPATGRTRWQHVVTGKQRLMDVSSETLVTLGEGTDGPGPTARHPLTAYGAHSGDRLATEEIATNGLPTVVTLAHGWCVTTSENPDVVEALHCYGSDGQPRWTRGEHMPQHHRRWTAIAAALTAVSGLLLGCDEEKPSPASVTTTDAAAPRVPAAPPQRPDQLQ